MKQTRELYPEIATHAEPIRRRAFRKSRGARKNEAGSSLVEFAVVLPLMLTLIMGMFVFGIALNQYLTLTNAAASGAQSLAFARGQTTDPCNTAVLAVKAAAPTLTQANLKFYFAYGGGAFTGSSTTSCSTQVLSAGQNAQIKVTYPCNLTVMGVNFAPNCLLTAQTAEAIQ